YPCMHEPGRVEQPAVAPFDTRRNDIGAIRTRETLERRLPCAVHERAVVPAVTDFARRKNDEGAAAAEPEVRGTESSTAPRCRLRSIERIDEETRIAKLGNPIEDAIREDADVRPHSTDQVEKHQSVDGAVRMIGRDDEWAACGNRRQILVGRA